MGKCLINSGDKRINAVAIQVINFFIEKGFTPKQACAIAGNVFMESSYVVNSGPHNDCNKSKTQCGPSFGLFMFHDYPCNNGGASPAPNIPCIGNGVQTKCCGLFSELLKWCKSNGYDYKTARGQLEFVWSGQGHNSKFQTVFKAKTNESIESLVGWWANNWEQCGTCHMDRRIKEAYRLAGLYNELNKGECMIDVESSPTASSESNFSCDIDSGSTDITYSTNDTSVTIGSANSADITLKKSKRSINEIIVHCTASREGQHMTVDEIRKLHQQQNGWDDIGYHYVIYLDGSIHNGRDVDKKGYHCENHNSHSVGVVYVGGVKKEDGKTPKDTRTEAQKKSLVKILKALKKLYPNSTIHGHYEYSTQGKPCPCFDVSEYKNI